MADEFTQTGEFEVERLRTSDASFLDGAVRAIGGAPPPALRAYGPNITSGIFSGGHVTGDRIGVETAIAAYPDIMWALVTAELQASVTATNTLTDMGLYVFGDVSGGTTSGPALVDTSPAWQYVATGGAAGSRYSTQLAGVKSIFLPLDPQRTKDGWNIETVMTIGATVPTSLSLDMRGVQLLGYPVNLWGTGPLWQMQQFRGS